MSDTRVIVTLDERARLAMALLAASKWPETEQAQEPHAVHFHSKQTRQFVGSFRAHRVVSDFNQLLDRGVSLVELFTALLCCRWPELTPIEALPGTLLDDAWLTSLAGFFEDTNLAAFWAAHKAPWQEAQRDLTAIFRDSRIISFLSQLMDQSLVRDIVLVPTIVYPMLSPVLAETSKALFLILPPAKAWGESPPWPFGEDPGWVISQTCWHLSTYFLAQPLAQLDEAGQALLRHAAVTLCLEQEFDEAEAMAYLVRSKKEHKLPELPLVTEGLRDYLAAPEGRSLLEIMN